MGLALLVGGAVTLVGSRLFPQWPEVIWGLQTLGWIILAGSAMTRRHTRRMREGGGYVEQPVGGIAYGLILAAVMFATMIAVNLVVPERFTGMATAW